MMIHDERHSEARYRRAEAERRAATRRLRKCAKG